MIRRISDLIGSRLSALAVAVAGAIALVGCANSPADETGAKAGAAAATAPAPNPQQSPARPAALASNGATASTPTKTVTLPPQGRVSLAEYRAQMRDQLMQSENAAPDVADCAAHASWVVPRSVTYDALKIPTGALGTGQATVEKWEGRFSQGKQAVPVTSVVTFQATAHERKADAQWEPVKVRCGYTEGMMLAYELLGNNGTPITEPAAAPAVATPSPKAHGKSHKGSKSTARSGVRASSASSKSDKPSASKSSAGKSTSSKSAKSSRSAH